MDASLLRLTLSEHFLNVDELLLQLKGGSSAPVKKKQPTNVSSKATSDAQPARATQAQSGEQQGKPEIASEEKDRPKPDADRPKTSSQRKNEIINDPAGCSFQCPPPCRARGGEAWQCWG